MAKAGDEYVMSGLKERDGEAEEWEKALKGVVEPLRASAWYVKKPLVGNDLDFG